MQKTLINSTYPEKILYVSSANNGAARAFQKARTALEQGEYSLALKFLQGYNKMVRYEDFYMHDRRSATNSKASVIIVTYGSGFDLVQCLKSVYSGTQKDIEIIVIDNGGNGAVTEILHSLPLLYVKCPINFAPSEARNIGAKLSRTPILIFLDDDALATPDFCQTALNAFRLSDAKAVRGKILPKSADAFCGTVSHYDRGNKPIPHPINTEGNSAWLKEAYMAVGGMDPLMFGHEGMDCSYRICVHYGAIATFYLPQMTIYHDFAHSSDKNDTKHERHEKMMQYLRWKYKKDFSIFYSFITAC